MNSEAICKQAFDTAFNKIKQHRDATAVEEYEKEFHSYTQTAFFDFGGDEYSRYSFLMKECEKEAYSALLSILCTLLQDKKPVPCQFKNENEFFIALPSSEHSFLGFYFKDYGIPSSSQNLQISHIVTGFQKKGIDFNELKIVCLVSDSAEKAVFNNDGNSQLISLKSFFEAFLSVDDYEILKTEEMRFTANVRRYLSISIVRTLSPNALFGFKHTVEFMIRGFEYEKLVDASVSANQISLIKKQFIENRYYKAILGKSDFSISFLTAEWLYDSLRNAGTIDLTSVVMGYFKSIEQFLFAYVSLHTREKETIHPRSRKIFVLKKNYIPLVDSVISTDKDAITLQALTSFFGYYKETTNNIETRNTDLLSGFIDKSTTYEAIVRMLNSITEIRNGYFHKDNITTWETVETARKTAYLFFFYFLGSYQFSDRDKTVFNIPLQNASNDFFKLCEYVHYHRNSIYYLFFDDELKIMCLASYDEKMSYDEYGDISYSGLHLRKVKWGKCERFILPLHKMISMMESNENETIDVDVSEQELLKCNIHVGEMKWIAEGTLCTGPITKIYDHGHYCAPEENDKPSY